MNDPGLDEPITDTAQQIKNTLRKQSNVNSSSSGHVGMRQAFRQELEVDDEEEEVGFGQPKRWWFTSTAFPLVAGTFGPLASLHSICALVHPWQEETKDPAWLIAINSVSLFLAIMANLSLLCNFGHRIKYQIAQPVTIVMWYSSAIMLLVPLILIPSATLTSAFYHAIIACALYGVISTLLLCHALGAYTFHAYPPSFAALTIPQRTLMLQSMSFVMYIGIGALVFSHIENWEYMNALYWADYSVLTVGLGTDFPLVTVLGRALIIPFTAVGILILGLVIGSVRGLVLERGDLKVLRRALGKERTKWLKKIVDEPPGPWQRVEFDTMRRIERRAEKIRKWNSLSTSLGGFLIVWLGGAAVFMACEKAIQNWTYAQSLYFSYTSLVTIGYGDFYPQSASGKPFFIVWSLVAVPTVTVFISNMGDTIVFGVREGALSLGNRTILSDSNTKKKSSNSKSSSGEGSQTELGADIEELGSAVAGAEEEKGKGDSLEARLAREIQKIAKDMGKKGVKYDWDEWARLLTLMGEVDNAHDIHQANASGSNSRRRQSNNQKNSKRRAEDAELSWLSDDGPLFSTDSETEWIMGRLCKKLEEVLSDR